MRLNVVGKCRVVDDGTALDEFCNSAVMRVVVQESRREPNGSYVSCGEPLFIDAHSYKKYVAQQIAMARKGDLVMLSGFLKCGYDKTGRPVAFVSVLDIGWPKANDAGYKGQSAQPQNGSASIPRLPADFSNFTMADVSALPNKETEKEDQ
jgi:hypothetical protein